QEVGERLHVLPAERVDDAVLARDGAPAHVREQVLPRAAAVALLVREERQVGAEERALEAVRLLHAELPDDVAHHPTRRRGGQRQDGDAAELLLEALEATIRRPEVVAPLGDAMRL